MIQLKLKNESFKFYLVGSLSFKSKSIIVIIIIIVIMWILPHTQSYLATERCKMSLYSSKSSSNLGILIGQ